MTKPERTMQQMNPLGSGGMWDAAVLIGTSVWAFVMLMSVVQYGAATRPELLIASALLFTLGIATHLWAAAPSHAPYRQYRFTLVALSVTVAAMLQIFAMHTDDVRMSVVWAPVAVALLMASASVYRPARDLYLTGLLIVALITAAIVLDGQTGGHPFGSAYVSLAVVGVVIIIIVGQASYTGVATRTLDAWNRTTATVRDERIQDVREQVSGDVTDQLSREFFAHAEPLLLSVIQSGRVTAAESEQARELASLVRARLLELNAQNWLQAAGADVVDEYHVVNEIDESVRAALITLCVGMQAAGIDRPHISLQPRIRPGAVSIHMRATVQGQPARVRVELAPYIRVAYVVFDNVRVSFRDGEVTLKFHYGDK